MHCCSDFKLILESYSDDVTRSCSLDPAEALPLHDGAR